MVNVAFVATQLSSGGERIELVEEVAGGIFRRAGSRRVPLAEWSRAAPVAGMTALAAARAAAAPEELGEDGDGVDIPPAAVARLGEFDAHALGLPPATLLTLQLRSSGSLAEGTIQVQARWIRRGGVPTRAEVTGARVREGGRAGRLAEPLRSVFLAASAVNAADDPDGRRAAFAALREALGESEVPGVDADGFIERIRIAYAANFSLDAKTSDGRFDFDPVLFGRQVRETIGGELVEEGEASLLTPNENLFFQTRFRGTEGRRRSYLLPDGTLLFLDPTLGRALEVVRDRQRASSQERRDFLRSPQRHLREALALDAVDDDDAADRLFIETRQFSERVSGIEVWQKPVLPWIRPKPNSWLPEAFGLRVGEPPDERFVELEPGDAEALVRRVGEAMERGEDEVHWRGERVPATSATLDAADGIARLERDAAVADDRREHDAPAPLQTFFLQVGQNFETLEYARLPRQIGTPAFEVPSLPEGVVSSPKPHQVQAFGWLAESWTRKLPGALLADDMGLGKTFQSLLFLCWLRTIGAPDRPVLVVAPTGLLRNWQAEIASHFAPGAFGRVMEAFGASLRQMRTGPGNDIRGGTTRLDVEGWDDAGVVLTTYETMRDYHMSFARVRFAAIVFDEAQKLKNPASQMARAAKTLNADMQLAMTGTPVENRLQDLWSIADIVYPGLLGTSREFEAGYPSGDREALQELQSLLVERDSGMPQFMLRRMKDEVLTGLPEKRSRRYRVEMPPDQAAAYDHVLARARALRQSGEPGAMLKVLHMLRGRSLHPIPPRGVADVQVYIGQSARLVKTFEILDEVSRAGEKVLIFCEDLEMQAFLAMAVQERFGLRRLPTCISGEVAGVRRQELVQAFQTAPPGFDVMILSPKAGGVGLTITAANHVIHLSRWWNPAVEDQATDRVYRIGQTRPVTVHIPIATHPDPVIGPSSFDHRLDELMERKRALSRGLLVPPESEGDVEDLLAGVLDGKGAGVGAGGSGAAPDEPASGAPEPEAEPATKTAIESEKREPPVGLRPGLQTEAAPEELPPPEEIVGRGARDRTAARPEPNEALPVTPEDAAAISSAPTLRPVLSMRETPVHAAERRAREVRRVEYAQYGPRDWTIFDQHLNGASIARLQIQDPYCCADDEARGRLVAFVRRFRERSARLDGVEVLALDAESLSSRVPETNKDQRLGLEQRWSGVMTGVTLHLVQRSRRAQGDLHDRFVKAHLDDGGHVVWDLGRGIDGVMSARYACVVNAYRESAIS